ncbi:hypothetical protein [Cellulomonas hominis]|uniref:hypothetical protein n=1 Tax=Cellulomonas hominis TaxID=156981 RepID=UPI001443D95B|nr:hypothetical protein [Cellulomonas hominis]NKY08957.1 hypothetical protein [Cellulomonas hominis]
MSIALAMYVSSDIDGRAFTRDTLTYTFVFEEFNNGRGSFTLTEAEDALPEEQRNALARARYDQMRADVITAHGWTPPVTLRTLTDFVLTVLDTRAQSEDGRTFTIVFVEFEGAPTGTLELTADEAALYQPEREWIASTRYNALRVGLLDQHGWAQPRERTLPEFVLTALDARATTTDGLDFQITFTEFAGATRHLTFTPEETALPQAEREALAVARYNALREELLAEHGLGS